MKIIDLLNKIANGELENGFTFGYDGYVWTYYRYGRIANRNNDELGKCYKIERCLNDEIDVINNNVIESKKNTANEEWKPKKDENYWYVDLDIMEVNSDIWFDFDDHNTRLKHKVVFATEEEAEEYLEYLQEKQKHMNTFTTKEEWKNLNVIKYYFTYDCLDKIFIIFNTGTCKENKLYFNSEEEAKDFAQKYEWQIKHELGVD